MDNSLYHDVICGIKASYPLIRDSPTDSMLKGCSNVRQLVTHNSTLKISDNDLIELKRIFYGGKTHADFHIRKEAHD